MATPDQPQTIRLATPTACNATASGETGSGADGDRWAFLAITETITIDRAAPTSPLPRDLS